MLAKQAPFILIRVGHKIKDKKSVIISVINLSSMPELPEVETVVRELNRKLKNKTVKSVSILLGKIIALGPGVVSPKRRVTSYKVKKFVRLLKGQKIASVARRAKLLIFRFYPGNKSVSSLSGPSIRLRRTRGTLSQMGEGNIVVFVHLKMTGQFIFFRKSELGKQVRIINKASAPLLSMPGKYTHAVLTFTDGSKLFYNDVRQFGYLKLVVGKDLEHVHEFKEFGPEPLDKNFTIRQFFTIVKNARKRKVAIKQLLMDPKFVAGIGNIYSDEILFRAKVKPERLVRAISASEKKAIYKAILFILKKGIDAKGSSVGDFIRTDGSWGSMGKHHFVYGRAGLPCKVCGSIIKSAKFGGRTGSFCPNCQK